MKIRSWWLLLIFLGTLGIPSSRADVSVNVVGYANIAMPIGYILVANPFDASPSNTLNAVMTNGTPGGTRVYPWNNTNQAFTAPSTFITGLGWDINYDISPGKGFMVLSSITWTQTFVGNVLQGNLTNFIAG